MPSEWSNSPPPRKIVKMIGEGESGIVCYKFFCTQPAMWRINGRPHCQRHGQKKM